MAFAISSCAGYKYNEDNLGEELTELAIKMETGQDLDLSPATPEKGFSPKSLYPVEKEANTPSEK